MALLACARAARRELEECLALQAASRRATTTRKGDLWRARLVPGATHVGRAGSRLGRAVGELMPRIAPWVTPQMRGGALQEGLRRTGAPALQTTVLVTLCGLLAAMERPRLALRTTEALAAVQATGQPLGRPRGARGQSQLDGQKEESTTWWALPVSQASIAKITGVDRVTLSHFIHSRGLRLQ